ncbi:hypothetical protein ABVF61_18075 [Roseibium sp. HPY-6]|uniref:hypothetical protein n=1 Tax=Roseibium sp. HPY-6 TaxID=3229852 RepID=UPI00338DED01
MNDLSVNSGSDNTAATLRNYLGPYEAWNFGIGKAYAFPPFHNVEASYLTALAELGQPEKPGSLQPADPGQQGQGMWLPAMWGASEDIALRFWPIVVENRSKPDGSRDSLSLNLVDAMPPDTPGQARFRMAFPVEDKAMGNPEKRVPGEPSWSHDPNVPKGDTAQKTLNVLGVIDDGIPFAHRNFRAQDGKRTRMEFCWLQSAHRCAGTEEAVLFGREFTRGAIEQLIRDHGADEDALYAAAGASGEQFGAGAAINRLATHGSRVMDVAAGADPENGADVPEETRLIAVQLPNTYGWDTSSFGKDMYMLSAVHYILERAERVAKGYGVENIRVTINISYGFSAGRHDGIGELEAALDELVSERRKLGRPTAMVIPSGNTFQDRLHGEINAADFGSGSFELLWTTQPNDRSSNYLEIWFPDGLNPEGFSFEIEAPFSKAKTQMELTPDPAFQHGDPRRFETIEVARTGQTDAIGQVSIDNHRKKDRWRVLVALAPSEPHDPDLPAAPAGDWKVTLKRGPQAPTNHDPIYLWVQRDIDLEPFLTGSRQSYLRDEDYRLVDDDGKEAESDLAESHVKRFGSLNGMATGATTLVVSGCRPDINAELSSQTLVPSVFSAAGKPSSDTAVGHVDCTALADRSYVSPGVVGAGTRSGSYSTVLGTSVAAPFVARRLSEAFATCSSVEIKQAESENYLPILNKVELPNQDSERTARLGKFLII